MLNDSLEQELINTVAKFGLPFWVLALIWILFTIVVSILSTLVTAYIAKKGMNFAQKQDIEDLTRKTESIKTDFIKHIEYLKHEQSLISHTYKLFVENIIKYYQMFYKHYMRCSRTTNYDIYYPKGGKPKITSDIFEDQLEDFSVEWNNQLGLIKILLPDTLLDIHKKAENEFNVFRDIVMKREDYYIELNNLYAFKPEYKTKLVEIFTKIEDCKDQMEREIRSILKVNELKTDG